MEVALLQSVHNQVQCSHFLWF